MPQQGGGAMSEPNRTRRLNCRVTEDEYALIERKMQQLGTKNVSAYLRKMALDGYVLRLDLQGVSRLVYLLSTCSNNLNQYAKVANTTGSVARRSSTKRVIAALSFEPSPAGSSSALGLCDSSKFMT